jgi:hypothetical protein
MGQVIYLKSPKVPEFAKTGTEVPAPFRFISTRRGCKLIVSKYLSSEQMMQLSYQIFLKAHEMKMHASMVQNPGDKGC